MKKIVIFLLLLSSLGSIAQTYQENLEKYWYFRHRLKEEFMYFSGDANIQGSHHVAENRNDDDQYIRWADGVWWLGHYIGVLALEYRLLKDNGQDYNETLDELNLAFDTYYRLDYNAELCFDDPFGWTGDPATNGFFLRDDIDESCSVYFDDYEIKAGYSSCQNGEEDNVNSQDQHIMMFLGLRLVHKLVDEPNIQSRADDMATLLIDAMHWFDPLILSHVWEIRNPITLGIPDGGKDFELNSFTWALAESAGMITGNNEHKGRSIFNKNKFDIVQSLVLGWLNGSVPGGKYNGYFTMVLSAMVNDGGGFFDPGSDGNSYEWFCEMYDLTKGFEEMGEEVGLFPHLILISEVLHGYSGSNRKTPEFFENVFLNNVPSCGSYNLDGSSEPPPWHTMTLFCPWHRNSLGDEKGFYNMLDYMILYDLYFYCYHRFSMHEIVNSNSVCPVYIEKPPPHVSYWIYTVDDPLNIYAVKQINATNEINSNGGIYLEAGKSVKLMPGFVANSSSSVKAIINPNLLLQPYYSKTYVNTCDGGVFEQNPMSYVPLQFESESLKHFNKSWKNGNTGEKVLETEDQFNSMNSFYNSDKIRIFPNPTSDIVKVYAGEESNIEQVDIYNPIGQKIYESSEVNSNYFEYDLSFYRKGIYLVKITVDENTWLTKIVKN